MAALRNGILFLVDSVRNARKLVVDRPRSNDENNDQGQRLMIRGERQSPGSLQAIASFKRAASSRVAHLGDQENINVQQVSLRFCLSIRLYAQTSGRGFQSPCFYR